MFTGIVAGTGSVKSVRHSGDSAKLTIDTGALFSRLKPGESISVDGVCLTVVRFSARRFSADLSAETLRKTTLGNLQAGDRVNLERAVRLADRIGGHWVTGHVDGIGTIRRITPVGDAMNFYIGLSRPLLRYAIEKGSIAVDGISLTINRLDRRGVYLMIIPHTLRVTTLGRKGIGASVNIENDLIGKYVERLIPPARMESGG